jgi:hypothetical protein
MHYRVYEWIKERFPHEGHRFVNGAIPGASQSEFVTHACLERVRKLMVRIFVRLLAATELFAFCFPEQIPEESDLVLVEFGKDPCEFPLTKYLGTISDSIWFS